MKKLGVILLGLIMSTGATFGQETAVDSSASSTGSSKNTDTGYNPLSVRPIHVSDIMWKKTLLRAMDLREKQNTPLFSRNKEITKLILEAVAKGELTPYANDSLERKLTIDEFNENLTVPAEGPVFTGVFANFTLLFLY